MFLWKRDMGLKWLGKNGDNGNQINYHACVGFMENPLTTILTIGRRARRPRNGVRHNALFSLAEKTYQDTEDQ